MNIIVPAIEERERMKWSKSMIIILAVIIGAIIGVASQNFHQSQENKKAIDNLQEQTSVLLVIVSKFNDIQHDIDKEIMGNPTKESLEALIAHIRTDVTSIQLLVQESLKKGDRNDVDSD